MTAFSYQLYSSRNFPPFKDTLRMLADLGYVQVEGYGALYADASAVTELTEALKASGLSMPTGHFSIDMLENDVDRVLEIARAVGIKRIYCPFLMPDARPQDRAGWVAFGERLQKASKPYRDAGLGFGWHNHDFEFVALPDGTIPQEAIFEGGPDLEWEADIAWIVKGGADPFDWINRHSRRITAAHVKDIAPAGENGDEDGWADPGEGTMEWPSLMTALRATNCQYFVMEHDNPNDHQRFATRAITAAKGF